jgi:hypothetical protein
MFLTQLFRWVAIFCLDSLNILTSLLENVKFKLDKFITEKEWRKPKNFLDSVKDTLSLTFMSAESFEKEFDKYMDSALKINPEHEMYRELLYYNFSLRYFIAYYEARFDKIPLQVYNEYRMAFDHFMRFFIDKKEKNDWNKALSHTRRGVLDILKLNCFWLQETVSQRHKSVPYKVFGFASEYIKCYSDLQVSAESALWEAKRKEVEICDDKDKNIEVIKNFIEAFLAHLRWDEYQRKNAGKIAESTAKYIAVFALRIVGGLAIIKVTIEHFGFSDTILGLLSKFF